jgi:hypothetical protein
MRRLLVLAALLVAGTAHAQGTVSPEDLNIPAARMPTWYNPAPVEALYDAAQGWTEYDVTCEADGTPACVNGRPAYDTLGGTLAACTTVALDNTGGIGCMLNSPEAKGKVMWMPAGTYEVWNGIVITSGNVVLRGAGRDGSGNWLTKLEIQKNSRTNNSGAGCDINNAGAAVFSICPEGTWTDTEVSWTSGYTDGTSVLGIANTTDFPAGTWVIAHVATDASCAIIDEENNPGDYTTHMAQVDSRSTTSGPGTITIDRPLLWDYSAAGCAAPYQSVRKVNPIVGLGIEMIETNLVGTMAVCTYIQDQAAQCVNNGTAWLKWPHIGMEGVAESWFVDMKSVNAFKDLFFITYSSRLWFQGVWTSKIGLNMEDSTEGMFVKTSTDIVMENMICENSRVCFQNQQGAQSTVQAYNYFDTQKMRIENLCTESCGTHPTGCNCFPEKGLFNHGKGSRHSLFEGNDLDVRITMWDNYWSRSGPYHMAYRNRNRNDGTLSNDCYGANWGMMISDYPSTHPTYIAEYASFIGNTALAFMDRPATGPSCPNVNPPGPGMTDNMDHLWAEKNAFRLGYRNATGGNCSPREDWCAWQTSSEDHILNPTARDLTLSCGTGEGDHATCPGTNVNTSAPVSLWTTENYPVSLYRGDTAPSWWCQEACAWEQNGIGAFGDDFGGALCKLPAQIRYENTTCTAMGAPAPPAGPSKSMGGALTGAVGGT